MSKKYNLSDEQLRDITAICYREQGRSEAGIKACASQMCNYHDTFWAAKHNSPYITVVCSGWYGINVKNAMISNRVFITDEMVEWVRDVINNGNRTLPEYVVEYDMLGDIKQATNNGVEIDRYDRSQYIRDVTKIRNVYGGEMDSYTFYCFPDGVNGVCDAFGYITKPKEKEEDTMGVTANQVLDIFRSWLGRNERDGSHKMIIDLYNSHKPLARGYAVQYTDQWCDTCLSAGFIKAGAVDLIGGTECGVEEHVKLFKSAGIWIEDGTIIPEPGDIIVYNWDKSYQPNDGYADHIGIVEAVGSAYITTIEGNYHDSVSRRTLLIGTGYIRGYARPKYGKKVTTDIIHDSNYIDVPKEPEKPQNEPKNGTLCKTVQRNGIITASALNVRTWAGTEYPNIKAYPQLPMGTKVGICDELKASDGSTWYYINFAGVFGFVCAKYVS